MFEQDRFMVRLRQRVLGERAIVAAWLAGSFGRNTPDPYSDIDIALVFDSAKSRQWAWQQRHTFCTSIMAYVPAKSFDNPKDPQSHVALYANGTLADFRYLDVNSLQPYWLEADIKILKDNAEQVAATIQQRSQGLTKQVKRVSSAELTTLDTHFWIFFWDTYRRARRGTPASGFEDYLLLVSTVLPTLLGGLRQDSAERNALINLHYTLQNGETLTHLRQLVTVYRNARQAIAKQHRLDYQPDASFEREIDRALKK